MDYYKLRSQVMQRIKDHLREIEEIKERGMNPPKFKDFTRNLMVEYGVTEKMVTKMVESLAPGATIKNGEIVRKE